MLLGSRMAIGAAIGVVACTMMAVAPPPPPAPTTTPPTTAAPARPDVDGRATLKAALDDALDDERLAHAFYEAVMAKHGRYRPFANIVNAELSHQRSLIAQYERFGFEVPVDRWKDHAFDVPPTFGEACDAAVVAEVRNGRIYDRLLADVADAQVRAVFEQLRWASLERHLHAFRRHSNGWKEVEADALCEEHSAMYERATAARKAMFDALFGELTGAMKRGGPANAIDVCSKRAPLIADEVARTHGVRIGRTSHKLRNAENTPPVWAELLVDERPTEAVVLTDDGGRLGALTPIMLNGACLQCHGSPDEMDPAVRDRLRRLYPADDATGFSEGDVRGWFWVEVPAGTKAGG